MKKHVCNHDSYRFICQRFNHLCWRFVCSFYPSKTQYMAFSWCASILRSRKSEISKAAALFSPTLFPASFIYSYLFVYRLVLPFRNGRVFGFGGTSLKAKRYRARSTIFDIQWKFQSEFTVSIVVSGFCPSRIVPVALNQGLLEVGIL